MTSRRGKGLKSSSKKAFHELERDLRANAVRNQSLGSVEGKASDLSVSGSKVVEYQKLNANKRSKPKGSMTPHQILDH